MTVIKSILVVLTMSALGKFSYGQNVLPPSGNVGIGTTSPTNSLEVMGTTDLQRVKVRDTAYFERPVIIKDSVTMERKLNVDQDIKVKGESVFVGEVKAKSDFKVLGITKMKGDAFVEGDFKFKSLADPSISDERFLMIKPNGKVEFMEKGFLNPYEPKLCITDVNGDYFAPVWSNIQGVNGAPGVLYTADNCPEMLGLELVAL